MTTKIKDAIDECIRQQMEFEKIYPSHARSMKLSILVLMAGKGYVPPRDEDRKEWLEYVEMRLPGK